MSTPLVIITRDRLSLTRRCVADLERFADQVEIHLVDHGSTYEPMIDWLAASAHPVHRCGSRPPRALWSWDGLARIVGNQPYLATDPDLVLDGACPDDWLDRMREELEQSSAVKVGLGLRIDDLPDTPLAAKVTAWESAFWASLNATEKAFHAPVDTTLALCSPLERQPDFALAPALRLNRPYLVRHLPWYSDYYSEETEYYRKHALAGTSHWANGGW
jgi:hypothetical protein